MTIAEISVPLVIVWPVSVAVKVNCELLTPPDPESTSLISNVLPELWLAIDIWISSSFAKTPLLIVNTAFELELILVVTLCRTL